MKKDQINRIFVDYLVHRMMQQNISQNELARRCGIKQNTISNYLTGKSRLTLQSFVTMSKILDPENTRNLIKIIDRDYILCKLVDQKSDTSDTYVPGHTARLMQQHINDGKISTPSHPFCPGSTIFQDRKETFKGNRGKDLRMLPYFCLTDGIWAKIAIDGNSNTIQHHVQLQPSALEVGPLEGSSARLRGED